MTITNTIRIYLNYNDITSLVDSYSMPTGKLDSYSSFSFVVLDEDFALYDAYIDGSAAPAWKDCQFLPVSVVDNDTDEYLFVGRVQRPIFKEDRIEIQCESIGRVMEDKTINSTLGIGNYIYAEGLISDPSHDANADQVEVTNSQGVALTMTDDAYIGKGLLIDDNTTISEVEWDADTAIVAGNTFDSVSGDGDDTHEAEEDAYITGVNSAGEYAVDDMLELEFSGTTFPDSNAPLEIEFFWDYTLKTSSHATIRPYCGGYIFIYNYTTSAYEHLYASDGFVKAISSSAAEKRVKGSFKITVNPENYIYSTGGNYTKIKIKFNMLSYRYPGSPSAYCYLDYFNFKVKYQSSTHSPMQSVITDNGADWFECTGETFEDDGVAVDDSFKVGERTDVILYNIFAFFDIPIDVDPTFSRFIARNYKGLTARDVLNSICLVENAHWWEEYDSDGNYKIMVRKQSNFQYDPIETYYEDDFEDDIDGNLPSGWTKGGNGVFESEADIGGHAMCVYCYANNVFGASVYGYENISTIEANSKFAFEFDMRIVESNSEVTLMSSSNANIRFLVDYVSSAHKLYLGANLLQTLSANTWYHIFCTIDLSAKTADVYIDTVFKGQFAIPYSTVTQIKIFAKRSETIFAPKIWADNIKIYKNIYDVSTVDRKSLSIERAANYYRSVRGLGNPRNAIDDEITDITIVSPLQGLLIDESINTMPDMRQILEAWLSDHKTLQESIKVTLNNDNNSSFKCGYNVYLNLTNPAITGTYPIRRVDYNYKRVGLKQTVLYLGMGQTDDDEHFIENQKKMLDWARKAHLYAQNPDTIVSSLSYSDLTNLPDLTVYLKKDGSAAQNLLLKDNEAASLDIKEGTNSYLKLITTNGGEKIQLGKALATSAQIQSTLATGTAPLSVSSTTKVTNLNADQLDGADLETTWTDSDTKICSSKAMKTKVDALIAAAGVSDKAKIDPWRIGTNGWVAVDYGIYGCLGIAHATTAKYLDMVFVVPKTGTYKFTLKLVSDTNSRTTHLDLYAGRTADADGTSWSFNNLANPTVMDKTLTAKDTIYKVEGDNESLTAGDIVVSRIYKDTNDGSGYLIIMGAYWKEQ